MWGLPQREQALSRDATRGSRRILLFVTRGRYSLRPAAAHKGLAGLTTCPLSRTGPPANLNPTLLGASPPPVPAPVPAQASAANPVFMPAGAFYGSIPGYVFKLGPWGLGYYLDLPPAPSTAAIAQQQLAQTRAPHLAPPAVPTPAVAPAPQVQALAPADAEPVRLKPPPPRTKGLKAPDAAPQIPAPPQAAPAPASTAASPAPAAPAPRARARRPSTPAPAQLGAAPEFVGRRPALSGLLCAAAAA